MTPGSVQFTNAAPTVQTAKAGPRFTVDYVHSAGYDWVFFLAPFWITAVYAAAIALFPKQDMLIFLASYVVLAETHFASTWLIFLDPANREHYASQKLVYYYIPALIMLACVGVSFFFNLKLVLFVAAVVAAVHVMRQSTGIVALYRRRIGDRDQDRRQHENRAIYAASFACLGAGFERFYLVPGALPQFLTANKIISSMLPFAVQASIGLCLLALVYHLFKVIQAERRNFRATQSMSLSRALVFVYSLALFSPYVFATRMEHAIAMGFGIHYVQYLGIVWWLNRNKYPNQPQEHDWGRKILGLMSQSVWMRLPYLLAYGIAMLAFREFGLTDIDQAPASWVYAITIGLQFVHYHLDAYLWRFSDPFVRNTVLKYL